MRGPPSSTSIRRGRSCRCRRSYFLILDFLPKCRKFGRGPPSSTSIRRGRSCRCRRGLGHGRTVWANASIASTGGGKFVPLRYMYSLRRCCRCCRRWSARVTCTCVCGGCPRWPCSRSTTIKLGRAGRMQGPDTFRCRDFSSVAMSLLPTSTSMRMCRGDIPTRRSIRRPASATSSRARARSPSRMLAVHMPAGGAVADSSLTFLLSAAAATGTAACRSSRKCTAGATDGNI